MNRVVGAGAIHAVRSLGWKPVTNLHTLRAISRAGYIIVPPEYGQRGGSAIGMVRHRYVFEGARSERYAMFTWRKRTFSLQWADGCFYPFLWEFQL